MNFTDQSTNNPNSWQWNFGDGTTSTQRNPSKTYNSAGTYIVSLTAANAYGSHTKTKTNYIQVNPAGSAPVAAFTASPTSGTAPLAVSFTDQSTNNSISWQWNFGDGNGSTQQNPAHTYNANGNYNVSLTVSNAYGDDNEIKYNYITVSEGGGNGQPCPDMPIFTDSRDGKTYPTVKIGNQCWMAENLAWLPSVVGPATGSQTTPYHYVYGYNGTSLDDAKASSNYQTYGVLYNWPAALQACPAGWHLPTDAEWKTLEMHMGMSQAQADAIGWRGTNEGEKLKETGTINWISPNTGATNESGFSALPGGYRVYGTFGSAGNHGYWWNAS